MRAAMPRLQLGEAQPGVLRLDASADDGVDQLLSLHGPGCLFHDLRRAVGVIGAHAATCSPTWGGCRSGDEVSPSDGEPIPSTISIGQTVVF